MKAELREQTVERARRIAEAGNYGSVDDVVNAALEALELEQLAVYSDAEIEALAAVGRESAAAGVFEPGLLAEEAKALIARKPTAQKR